MFLDESTQVVSQNRSRTLPQHTAPGTQRGKICPKGQPAKQPVAEFPLKPTGFIMYQPLDDLGVNFSL
jgi:hypothetical protein